MPPLTLSGPHAFCNMLRGFVFESTCNFRTLLLLSDMYVFAFSCYEFGRHCWLGMNSDWEGKGSCTIVPWTWKMAHQSLSRMFRNGQMKILIHYVCNAHFHRLWRQKFAALKSLRLCHESSDDVTSLATRRSNITKTFWKCVTGYIRMN